jgi:hypothetical protein
MITRAEASRFAHEEGISDRAVETGTPYKSAKV